MNRNRADAIGTKEIGEREFVWMIALVQSLQALAIDAMLPALGIIALDFGLADPNRRQLVIAVFLLGSGLGSLIPGSLADRYGRKPVLLACIASYIVLAIACALVTDFETLIALRFLQAIGCSGMMVVPGAIIRDRFSGDHMARMLSLVGVVFMIVPVLAPLFGQAVLLFAGWRWIFGLLAGMAAAMMAWCWLRLPETMHAEFRQPILPRAIAANMARVLVTRESIGYILCTSCTSAILFGFLNTSQQLIAEHFRAGNAFALVFGTIVAAMALANFFNARIVMRYGARRVSHVALFVYLALGAAQVIIAAMPGQALWQFIVLMAGTFALMGFLSANFNAIALQPFARTAGAAASVQTFLRMMLGAIFGALIGQAYDGTALPLALAMLIAGLASLALVLFSERGRLFRRAGDAH